MLLISKKTQSEDVPPTTTVAHLSDWTGGGQWQPNTFNHWAPPAICHPERNPSHSSECNSQQPLCLQHVCISWSLKVKQTKKKKKTCWCPDPILSLALHPFPFSETPAGIGPQNNKELNWGKKWIALPFPIMHPCTISEQREKPARKITKSITFFSNVKGPRPPEVGSEVWDKSRDRERGC